MYVTAMQFIIVYHLPTLKRSIYEVNIKKFIIYYIRSFKGSGSVAQAIKRSPSPLETRIRVSVALWGLRGGRMEFG